MLAHSLIAPDSRDGTETLGRALRHEGNGGNGGNDRHGGNEGHCRNEGNERHDRNEGNEGHGGNGGNGGNEGNVGRKGTSGDVVRSFILRPAEGATTGATRYTGGCTSYINPGLSSAMLQGVYSIPVVELPTIFSAHQFPGCPVAKLTAKYISQSRSIQQLAVQRAVSTL